MEDRHDEDLAFAAATAAGRRAMTSPRHESSVLWLGALAAGLLLLAAAATSL